MNTVLPDNPIRELILNDLNTNIMVEAAAGTGKTTSIVGRMVNLIARGKCEIDNLAAVTFTRKAAAELRERFQTKMRHEITSDRPADEVKRLRGSIDRIEYAFVGTFHSFCSMLLRERPIECDVEPEFREIDEAEDARLREQSWQIFLNDLYSKQDNRLDRIQELGLKTSDLKNCFNCYVEFLDIQDWPHWPPDPIDIEALKANVLSYVEDMRLLAPTFPRERGTDEMMNRYEQIVRATDNSDWRIVSEFFNVLELFDSSSIKTTQKCWNDKNLAKAERDRFRRMRESVVLPALDWWYGHRYEFVVNLLEQSRSIYNRLRRASGGLDFQDLLLRTAESLKAQPNLRRYFQRRFSHLLVDEFQDTDPIQAEVLAYLTSENHEETTWQDCVPKKGSLFLVGDPKQSIYRFRRADIVTYQQVRAIYERTGGRILTLSTNFRSSDVIRNWINQTFDSLFANINPKYSPSAVDLELGRTDASTGELSGVYRLPVPQDLSQADAVAFESDCIARYIKNAIAAKKTLSRTQRELDQGKTETVEPGDFLIVSRNKTHLHAYSEALDRYGINNEVTGSNAFQNIAELGIMLDCLRAIDDPTNPVPYVSVLRGELFGFGDADLYELRSFGGRFSYAAPLPEGLPEPIRARYENVNHRFSNYRRWLRCMPFTSAFANIASDLGILARCSTNMEGDIVAGGFLKAVEWVRSESWNFDSTNDVITYLENIICESETDSCSVLPTSGSRVRIMNLHKVKGLEAPVVFLACTSGVWNHEPHLHVDRTKETPRGYLAIEKTTGKWPRQKRRPIAIPSDWEHFKAEEKAFEDAEEIRLLYVATTRAACQLVVSQALGSKDKKSHWKPLHDFIGNLPELDVPRSANLIKETTLVPPKATLTQSRRRIQESWQSTGQPSYAVVAAKSSAMKEASSRPAWRTSGDYGTEWGSAIHALLEIRLRQPDRKLDPVALRLADQFDLGVGRTAEMISTVDSVVASRIWLRAERSPNIYTEIPFETASGQSPIPTITRGVIDLCFEEADGWVIVDYKTDDIQAADIESATAFYRPQLLSYAEFWQSITGHVVIETGLLFTKVNHYSVVALE